MPRHHIGLHCIHLTVHFYPPIYNKGQHATVINGPEMAQSSQLLSQSESLLERGDSSIRFAPVQLSWRAFRDWGKGVPRKVRGGTGMGNGQEGVSHMLNLSSLFQLISLPYPIYVAGGASRRSIVHQRAHTKVRGKYFFFLSLTGFHQGAPLMVVGYDWALRLSIEQPNPNWS